MAREFETGNVNRTANGSRKPVGDEVEIRGGERAVASVVWTKTADDTTKSTATLQRSAAGQWVDIKQVDSDTNMNELVGPFTSFHPVILRINFNVANAYRGRIRWEIKF